MKRILTAAVLLMSGCYLDSFMDGFEQPFVKSVSPAHNSRSVSPETAITVNFSKEMDTVRTNNGFFLSCSSTGTIDGFFAWENGNKKLTFTPRRPLADQGTFMIRVTEDAEDISGNDLKDEFVSVFYVNESFTPPFVESFYPHANSIGNPPDTEIVISFSEQVDMNTVYDGVTVSPAVQGFHEIDPDGRTVRYSALYGFSYGVTYTVKADRSLLDLNGNRLLKEVSFSFTVGDDFERPALSVFQDNGGMLMFDESFITGGAEKDGNLVIEFSKQVKTAELFSAVRISPSVPFFVTASLEDGEVPYTRAVVNFTENLKSEENYTLNIGSTITDLQDNRLDRDYRFRFITDGPGSIAPFVTAVGEYGGTDWSRDEVPVFSYGDNFLSGLIRVDFSAQIDPVSLNLRVERAAGSGGGHASITDIDWNDELNRLTFRLNSVMSGNIYMITIRGGSGGLRDLNSNFMKEDFIQPVRF